MDTADSKDDNKGVDGFWDAAPGVVVGGAGAGADEVGSKAR